MESLRLSFMTVMIMLTLEACGEGEGPKPLSLQKASAKVIAGSFLVGLRPVSSAGKESATLLPLPASPQTTKAWLLHNSQSPIKKASVIGEVSWTGTEEAKQKEAGHAGFKASLNLHAKQTVALWQLDFFTQEEGLAQLAVWQEEKLIVFWEPNRLNELYFSGAQRHFKTPLSPYAAALTNYRALTGGNFFAGLLAHYQEIGEPWWFANMHVMEALRLLAERDNGRLSDAQLKEQAPVIAVLDSGVDYLHPALAKAIWENPQPGSAGCREDRFGCDVTRGEGDTLGQGPALPFASQQAGGECPDVSHAQGPLIPFGACVHGTHVAGIIAGDIAAGVAGLCPFCKILPVKVVMAIDEAGKVADSAILKALTYILNINREHGLKVRLINSSFGKFERSLAVALLVRELEAQGVLLVAAAGNENTQERVYPAALSEAIAVTAIARSGKKASYANFGSWVDLAAPGGDKREGQGEGVLSALPGGGVGLSQGSSVASPMVAGLAGLLLMAEPALSVLELKKRLIDTANRKLYDSSFAGGYNHQYNLRLRGEERQQALLGAGLVDARAALSGEQGLGGEGGEEARVKPGCGVLGPTAGRPPEASGFWIVYLLFPIAWVLLRGLKGAR